MVLINSLVDRSLKNENASRVVVFIGGPRGRGYVVGSESEELKIRSFLQMFYFAHLSILLLGGLVATASSRFFVNALSDRPAVHLLSAMGIALGAYSLVVGLPYFLLWRSYKRAIPNFVSADQDIEVSGTSAGRSWIFIFALLGLITLFLAGVLMVMIRPK